MAALFKLASKAGKLASMAQGKASAMAAKAQGMATRAQGLANRAQNAAGQVGLDTDSLLSSASGSDISSVSDDSGMAGMMDPGMAGMMDPGMDGMMDPGMGYVTPQRGTRTSTYVLCISCLALAIGVILILVSNSQCQSDPNGTVCKNNKTAGIVMTTICALLILCICYMRMTSGTF